MIVLSDVIEFYLLTYILCLVDLGKGLNPIASANLGRVEFIF